MPKVQMLENETFRKLQIPIKLYTILQKYAHIGLKQNLLRSTTLDIITRLLDNAAFICVTWWEDFLKISQECVG